MVDIATIGTAISSIKEVYGMSKALLEIRDESIMKEKVRELNDAILNAQSHAFAAHSEQLSLLKRVHELEQEKAAMEKWEEEKEKYELIQLNGETFAYSLKTAHHSSEPAHKICATCYGNRKKSLLQSETRDPGHAKVYVCHGCHGDIYAHGCWREEHGKRK